MTAIIIDACPSETRAVLADERGPLAIAFAEPRGATSAERDLTGAVFRGRVTAVDKARKAAFVDIGSEQPGFLNLDQGAPPQEGETRLVQVRRDPEEGKGALLTERIRRSDPFVEVERHDEARKAWPRGLGAGLSDEAIEARAARLGDVLERMSREGDAPQRLDPIEDPVLRAVAALADRRLESVRLNAPDARQSLRALLADAVIEVELDSTRWAVDEAVEQAVQTVFSLDGGGSVALEKTRGLWAADVDAGGAGAGFGSDAARAVNRSALKALPRILRLADAGGLIVVDLVGAPRGPAAKALEQTLASALKADPTPCRTAPINPFGLATIARRKDGPAVVERIQTSRSEAAAALRALDTTLANERAEAFVLTVPKLAHDWIDRYGGEATARLRAARGPRFAIEAGDQVQVKQRGSA